MAPTQSSPHIVATQYWHRLEDSRLQCDLCPRYCKLREGQRGLCYVRGREGDQIVLHSYGKSSGFCIDPIEKKPLNHFFPGSAVLSFGSAGCNLACKFCQNWDMSKSREMDTLSSTAMPEQLALAAQKNRCQSIAFTYNDPVIFLEYAVDTAAACKEKNIYSVAVSAGYISEKPREIFFQHMDAANIDLKAFNNHFYKSLCGADLQNILETLLYIRQETNVWLELTTLLIPDQNDSEKELHEQCEWVYEHLGADTPLHFTAFHPDWKMQDTPPTPSSTLTKARDIALKSGLHFVYTGNVHDQLGGSTYCANCSALLIERDWYNLGAWNLEKNGQATVCQSCKHPLPGVFDASPGRWGNHRQPLTLT